MLQCIKMNTLMIVENFGTPFDDHKNTENKRWGI